ncbi:MAG TPA: O-antigen ligase family protein [bacterium]|nr:O-antigen ligase family protein [bacterium]
MSWLILVVGVLWLILSWSNLKLALSLLFGLLPVYLLRFKVGFLPSTVLEEFIVITTMVWLIKSWPRPWKNIIRKPQNWHPYPFTWEIIIILIIAWIAVAISGYSLPALGIWKAYFIEPILVFVIALNVWQKPQDIVNALLFLAGSVTLISLLAGYQYFTGQLIFNPEWASVAGRRATSFFGYPNAIGLFVAPVSLALLGCLIYLIKERSKLFTWSNILLAASIILSWLALYWAHSEGAIVGLIIAIIVMIFLSSRGGKVVSIILTAILVIVTLENPGIYRKISLADESGQIRRAQWQETWEMLRDGRLFTGAGLANYQSSVKPYHKTGIWLKPVDKSEKPVWQPVEIYLYPHNIILNFWSELGLLGMIIFMWLWFKSLFINCRNFCGYHLKNNLAWLNWGLFGAWLAAFIHGLVDVPYFKNDLAVLFWLGLALTGWLNWQLRGKLKSK